jgi:hypothetical protein
VYSEVIKTKKLQKHLQKSSSTLPQKNTSHTSSSHSHGAQESKDSRLQKKDRVVHTTTTTTGTTASCNPSTGGYSKHASDKSSLSNASSRQPPIYSSSSSDYLYYSCNTGGCKNHGEAQSRGTCNIQPGTTDAPCVQRYIPKSHERKTNSNDVLKYRQSKNYSSSSSFQKNSTGEVTHGTLSHYCGDSSQVKTTCAATPAHRSNYVSVSNQVTHDPSFVKKSYSRERHSKQPSAFRTVTSDAPSQVKYSQKTFTSQSTFPTYPL